MKRRWVWLAILWMGCGAVHAAVPGVKVPAYERLQLPNGATVLLMAQREVPLIAFTALVRGGSTADSADRGGTASLLAGLLQKGAGKRDAYEFADAVDRVGGRISVDADREYVAVSGSFLARDRELMVKLLADMLQRPQLEPDEFEKLRARQIEYIRAAKQSELASLVSVYGDAALLPSHPYGRPVAGSEASLARVNLSDVRSFYEQQVGADRLILSVVGDFEPREMKRLLTAEFTQWRKAALPAAPSPNPVPVFHRHVVLVDAPESVQSYFWIGNVGIAKNDPRRASVDIANTLFGGRFTSLLNSELRIRSGLTYGARSRFERYAVPGFWSITSYTRTDTTGAAIDLALEVLQRLHQGAIDAAALDSGRRYLLGQFPLALETADQWAGKLSELEFYGLDRSYIEDYAPALQRTDLKAVQQAVATAFPKPDQALLVVIGQAAKIRESLRKYGEITEMKLSDPEFSPTSVPAASSTR